MWLTFFFSSRRRHTRCSRDWSSDVCSSDLGAILPWFEEAKHLMGTKEVQGSKNNAAILDWAKDLDIHYPRSEERRVGKECRSRRPPYHLETRATGATSPRHKRHQPTRRECR